MKHFRILTQTQNIVSDNLTEVCKNCFEKCDSEGKVIKVCPLYGDTRRHGKRNTNNCICFLCENETKTTKLFRLKLEALSYSYPDLKIPFEQIRIDEQKKINRLIHNLTSLNAHNIQEVYNLIPQDILAQNWHKQKQYILEEMKVNPEKAASMFIRIAKHNTHMKSEFSIYRKLDREDSISLEIREHKLRIVLLNTLHTFFSDFSQHNVFVDVKDFYYSLCFDYETIQVALYHLLENAAKYTKPHSNVLISAYEESEFVVLNFEMESLFVREEERTEILKEGISGKSAKKIKKHGDGIGLWRINQMLEINNGKFTQNFGKDYKFESGVKYSNNSFQLKFRIDNYAN